MSAEQATCDECGKTVVKCDNSVWLDYPAVPYHETQAMWTIMRLGNMEMASVGDAPPSGLGHALHEHQPADSVMA